MPTVDWPNKAITVFKTDMVLVDPGPPREIYQLDTDALRLALKDLEDDVQGMAWPDTHQHNTPVTVSGVTLARVIEFINGYTIEFEDGPYAVNLVGSNNNIADVVVANQVQVRSNNSTGLQDLNSLQAASFDGAVTVNLSSTFTGSVFPVGTRGFPVNNFADAKAIADARGIPFFNVVGSSTLDAADYSSGYTFQSDNANQTTLTVPAGADVDNCVFRELTVTGTIDANVDMHGCTLAAPMSLGSGQATSCVLGAGTYTLTGTGTMQFLDCWSGVPGAGTPILDFAGNNKALGVRGYNGGIRLQNKTGAASVSIDLNSGQAIIDDTVTAGTVLIRGVGRWANESTYAGGADVQNQTVPQELVDIWRLRGLDPDNPLTISPTGKSAGGVTQTITQGATSTTVTRT